MAGQTESQGMCSHTCSSQVTSPKPWQSSWEQNKDQQWVGSCTMLVLLALHSPSPAAQRALSCNKGLRKLKGIFSKPSLAFTQLLTNSIAVHVLTCLTFIHEAFQGFTGSSWARLKVPAQCSEWQQQRHEVLLVHLQQTSRLFIRNTMHYPLPPCLLQAQGGHKTPWPNNTEEGMQKAGLQFFLLLMFAEVKHTNWDLEWSMHTSILKWLISQLKPLNLIVKNQRNAIYGSTVHQFQGRYPTPHQPLQPLKAPQKNTQDLLSRAGTQWLGCSKEKAVELQLLVPSDSRHLQHPSKHWGALAVSHGQLLSGGLPRDNSGFHTEMPTEGHWCRKLELHEAPWSPPRGQGQDHCWHLGNQESGN